MTDADFKEFFLIVLDKHEPLSGYGFNDLAN